MAAGRARVQALTRCRLGRTTGIPVLVGTDGLDLVVPAWFVEITKRTLYLTRNRNDDSGRIRIGNWNMGMHTIEVTSSGMACGSDFRRGRSRSVPLFPYKLFARNRASLMPETTWSEFFAE
jgi:hypothetical protein